MSLVLAGQDLPAESTAVYYSQTGNCSAPQRFLVLTAGILQGSTGIDGQLYLLRLAANGSVPSTGQWQSFGSMPGEPRSLVGSVAIGHQLYMFGGQETLGHNPASSRVDRFNLKTLCWESLAPLPRAAMFPSCASPNGEEIYCLLGTDRAHQEEPILVRYAIATDSWNAMPALPVSYTICSPSLVALNASELLMFAGSLYCEPSSALSLTYTFSLGLGAWLVQGNMTSPRAYGTGLALGDGKTAVAIGGQNSNGTKQFADTLDVFHAGVWEMHRADMGGAALTFPSVVLLPSGTGNLPGTFMVAGGLTNTKDVTADAFQTQMGASASQPLPPLPRPMRSAVLQVLTLA